MKKHLTPAKAAACLALWLLLGACHTLPQPEPSLDTLVRRGTTAFEKKKWDKAIEAFQMVKDRFPFSPHALTAEMRVADALYMQENYQEAAAAFQEFERLHPRNELVPYAVYMQGMSHREMMLSRDRDQTPTAEALRNFERLAKDYPDSPLVSKAREEVFACKEKLAAQELYVANWYRRTSHAKSALNRLKYLLANYPDTASATEAGRVFSEVSREVADQQAKKGEKPAPLGWQGQQPDSGGWQGQQPDSGAPKP
ncbi:MAG: outer membrane protein assembly factor BamD [Pseudomonadota bacterium]